MRLNIRWTKRLKPPPTTRLCSRASAKKSRSNKSTSRKPKWICLNAAGKKRSGFVCSQASMRRKKKQMKMFLRKMRKRQKKHRLPTKKRGCVLTSPMKPKKTNSKKRLKTTKRKRKKPADAADANGPERAKCRPCVFCASFSARKIPEAFMIFSARNCAVTACARLCFPF